MPPIDQPRTSERPSLSARISDAVSSPMRRIESLPLPSVVFRIPSLSKTITRRCLASSSTKAGAQASMVPDRPMIITSGRPVPTDR